jgi:hypothetical protein
LNCKTNICINLWLSDQQKKTCHILIVLTDHIYCCWHSHPCYALIHAAFGAPYVPVATTAVVKAATVSFFAAVGSLVSLLFGFQTVAGVHIVDGVIASSSIFAVS